MKQKRKVKSLISSRNRSNVFGATLLFLLGGVLFFGAISLLVSSIGVEASAASNELEAYYDMEDNREVLFKLGLIPEGGSNPVNEMYFEDYSLFVKGDTGISVDDIGSNFIKFEKNVNFLGGDGEGANIDSYNVTIIGGGSQKILEGNPNAVSLGGENNTISEGNSSSEAPVMLGGENNVIGKNQKGSAIAGGSGNRIGNGVSYGFILGGERNVISSGNENVIVGGANVEVRPGMSDLFVFSDGKGSFRPEGSNAFYIDVEGGLGLDSDSVNGGVTSEGAISFGEIDIFHQSCDSQDVGVQGSWSGCLVGCTQAGVNTGGKWEMIDHGNICKEKCKNNSSRCMISSLEIEKPNDYPSYCTTGGVNTRHSTQCAANLLTGFANVVFETYLIDSDDLCPNERETHNKCVFRCDTGFHLTGDLLGDGKTMCYKDCVLPWDTSVTKKHNEMITGYNVRNVSCSNDDYKFPRSLPGTFSPEDGWTKELRVSGGASYESCTNKDHQKTLVCYDGEWYLSKIVRNEVKADTGKQIYSTEYNHVYEQCNLTGYRCDTGVYNLTRDYIVNTAKDTVNWVNIDRNENSSGTRGRYKLCLDWNADTPTQNGASCSTGNITNNYHYKLVACQPGYHTGVGFENECKHDCYLTTRNGETRTSHHSGHVIGYKTGDVTCGTTCESRELVCDDGKWRIGSLNGNETTDYKYNDCFISHRYCDTGVYNTTVTYPNSYYDSCVDLKGNNTNNTCENWTGHYKLINCDPDYHFTGGRSDAIMCDSNYRYFSCESVVLPSSIPENSHRIGTYTRHWKCPLTGNESRCWESSNNCDWECKDHYWQPTGYNLCCHDSEHLERGSCEPNHKVGSCNMYAGTLGGTNCYWSGQAELEWNGVRYVYQGGCTQVCTGCQNGTTQTTYTRAESCECENYITTSTCENGEWNPALISCTEPATGCGGGGGCTDGDIDYGECECNGYMDKYVCIGGSWSSDGTESCEPDPDDCGGWNGCTGPCGSVGDGDPLTCYQTDVQCTGTALSESHTCSNGSWSNGGFSHNDYEDSTPNLSSYTCDSSYSCLSDPGSVSNGSVSECTEYSQDGTDNACVAGDTKWKVKCNSGYHLSNDNCSCEKDTDNDCKAGTCTVNGVQYSYSAFGNGTNTTASASPSIGGKTISCSVTATCSGGNVSCGDDDSCSGSRDQSCGELPYQHATWVRSTYSQNIALGNNVWGWSPSTPPTLECDGSGDCSYTCGQNRKCAQNGGCTSKHIGVCDESTIFGCDVGTGINLRPSGSKFTWICHGDDDSVGEGAACEYDCSPDTPDLQSVSCVNQPSPQCGSANGSVVSSIPSSNLCDEGTASTPMYYQNALQKIWDYEWTCSTGGVSTGCMAYAEPQCGPAVGWSPMEVTALWYLSDTDKCGVGWPADGPMPGLYSTRWDWQCNNGPAWSSVNCRVDLGCPEGTEKIITNPNEPTGWACMEPIEFTILINKRCGTCQNLRVDCGQGNYTRLTDGGVSYCNNVSYPYSMAGEPVNVSATCDDARHNPDFGGAGGTFNVPDSYVLPGSHVVLDISC